MSITMQDLVNNPEGISASDVSFNDGTVASALATKQDKLTFDTTPTASSTNPVTSGGVKTALDGKQAAGDYALNGQAPGYAAFKFGTSHVMEMLRTNNQYCNGVGIMGVNESADPNGITAEWLAATRGDKKIVLRNRNSEGVWTDDMYWSADEDTGWLTLDANGIVKYRKKNGYVTVSLYCVTQANVPTIAAKTWDGELAVLPTGFRPTTSQLTTGYARTTSSTLTGFVFAIETDGKIHAFTDTAIGNTTHNNIYAQVSFPV